MIRNSLKTLAWSAAGACGAFRLGRRLARGSLVVLTYHHVLPDSLNDRIGRGPNDEEERPRDSVFASEFERQVALISRLYHVVCGEELRAYLVGALDLPAYSALITFDDGYADNYDHALPILRRYRAPAIVFVTSELVGRPGEYCWFDRFDAAVRAAAPGRLARWLQAHGLSGELEDLLKLRRWFKDLGPAERARRIVDFERALAGNERLQVRPGAELMTWRQVRELAAAGMTIGSHTATHQVVASASAEELEAELGRSRERIEAEVGRPCWCFSYPNGTRRDFGPRDSAAVRAAGYLCAFTQLPGFVFDHSDRYALPRMSVPDSGDLNVFMSRAAGVHARLERLSVVR